MQALFKITAWGGLAHAMSVALLALLVAACEGGAIEKAKQHDPLAPIREADFSAPPPETLDRPAGATVDEQDVKTPAKTIVPGNGSFAQPPKGTARFAEGEGGIQLSFDNADLREVVRIVLGDILGIDYILDPRVQGSVTFSSTGPLPRDLMLSTLETVLRMNNASIAVSDSIYRVIPTAEVIGQPSVVQLGDQNEPLPAAHGLTIVPLNHVSAGSMVQLLENVVARPGAVRPDPVRNLLLVTGTSRERSSILATVSSFDVDWLRGQSAGIFPLKHGTPETLIVELESIFQSQPEGLGSNLVRFQPIERLNAVLVIARRLELLQEAELWIERLDQANTIGLNLYVYYVQNSKAEDLADILNETFQGIAQPERTRTDRHVAPSLDPVAVSSNEGDAASQAARAAQAARQAALERQQARARRAEASDGRTLRRNASAAPPALGDVGEIRVIPDQLNNALLVLATRQGYDLVLSALRQIDVPPLQVLIDATIAEITLNDDLRYGVQFFLKTEGIGGTDDTIFGFSRAADSLTPLPVTPGFNFLLNNVNGPRFVLDALSEVTDVKVISSPSVVVLDNQTATLQVGDEVPVTTQQSQSTIDIDSPIVNTIEFRDTGVILEVTPRINSSGLVTMEIEQEVSNVVENSANGELTPTISQRRIASSIAVNSSQTVVLGGLISENQFTGKSGIPVLRELPLLGPLFGTTDISSTRTELVVFITPRVIRNADDAQEVAEELRARMRSLAPEAAADQSN